jgi:hypothetical protein
LVAVNLVGFRFETSRRYRRRGSRARIIRLCSVFTDEGETVTVVVQRTHRP